MNELAVTSPAQSGAAEARFLGRELANDYRTRVQYQRVAQGLSDEEALTKAAEPCPLGEQFRIMDCPPEEVGWSELHDLARSSPDRAADRWNEIKEAARQDVRSGFRAVAAVRGHDQSAWNVARFLAVREELSDGWQPRNGVERQLVDMRAQSQTALNFWLDQVMQGHGVDEAAGAMADRFGRMFARLVRVMSNLRKVPMAVVVQNAGQVNVGGQQINVSEARS
jgi:hypothetical protein